MTKQTKTTKTVNLLGKDYPYKFGMKFQRIYMGNLNITKLKDYEDALASIVNITDPEAELSAFDAFGYFVISAVQAASKKDLEFDIDDILDFVESEGATELTEMFNDFAEQRLAAHKANQNKFDPKKKQ